MTRDLALLHTRAGVLAAAFPRFVSEFERGLIDEIARRRQAFGDAARITEAEADRLRDLVAGLEGCIRRMFERGDMKAWFEVKLVELVGRIGEAA